MYLQTNEPPGRGNLALQDGEEVSFSELIPYPLSGAFAAFLQLT